MLTRFTRLSTPNNGVISYSHRFPNIKSDTVCNSDWGYGLSSGIQGSMSNLDNDAFRDAFMVAHEIGHSLGSGERILWHRTRSFVVPCHELTFIDYSFCRRSHI